MAERDVMVGQVLEGYAPLVGAALWRLEETRARTLRLLKRVTPDAVDRETRGNSVGTILYHVALIEVDWLYADILQRPFPERIRELLPVDDRDEHGVLSVVRGQSIEEHLERLREIRGLVLSELRDLSDDDFVRPRSLPNYDVTPEWALHHLTQHEAEHRGELGVVAGLAV